jgi:hypothetical protein
MKRFLTLALVTSLFFAGAAQANAKITPRERLSHCRYGSLDGNWKVWGTREVKRTIECAAQKFPTSLSTALYVADRESGFYARAVNPSSGTCGIFQHMPQYWPGRVAAFRHAHPAIKISPSCFNARSNVLVAIWMAHTGGWGPWGM